MKKSTGDTELADAERCVKAMEDLEDTYFGADKEQRMSSMATEANECMDQILANAANPPRTLRVRTFYLRGRAASLSPDQERVAETLLSKAIKLDPQCLAAWNALGDVYWNLGDMVQARQCFEQALELCGKNSVSLRNLSTVLRAVSEQEAKGDVLELARCRAQNFAAALEKAKEAVALDMNDPQNWETLGNAYFGDCFVNVKPADMDRTVDRSLTAYQKADALYERQNKPSPYLQMNRAKAAKYVENYDLAIDSFRKAHKIGAAGADEAATEILDLCRRLATAVRNKGDLKSKRLRELAGFHVESGARTLEEIRGGENAAQPLVARVINILDQKDETPTLMVCCDNSGAFFALSLYHVDFKKVADTVVPMKSILVIRSAELQSRVVHAAGDTVWEYPCVRVVRPVDVSIHGGVSFTAFVARSEFSAGKKVVSCGVAGEEPASVSVEEKEEALDVVTTASHDRISVGSDLPADVRSRVAKATLDGLRKLMANQCGPQSLSKISRVETMLERIGRNEMLDETNALGRRHVAGYIADLTPATPFHSLEGLSWSSELQSHWTEIRDELRRHLDEHAWQTGAISQGNEAYGPTWRISEVYSHGTWQHGDRWKVTHSVLKRLQGISISEVFFARLAGHSTIDPHSDNTNYILTCHLGLDLQEMASSLQVGNEEVFWEEGEMFMFDHTFVHSARNFSSRHRYALVVRLWHPQLSEEERIAIDLAQGILASTAQKGRR
uniref:Aspartyl/asparaginy/proline hydroxylase domain-containing protein n=1 Tax=Noctiluca scintillans TaxID=2966 RepID=A0A7S1F7Z2_NOCSC|mmetsp:Transcript_41864/g.110904  ORF Transcript_41864/g.110904 Transcript_41864/m.110904 type:complete len:731 (+) Transcript_41864:50-2242(+)